MRAAATAHPNIALIKYWGKRDVAENLPATGSISVTLDAFVTRTTVDFDARVDHDVLVLNDKETPSEQPRLKACLDALRSLGDVNRPALVTTSNDFPTGAGLASSASGYAALVTAGAAALGLDLEDRRLLDIARIGSGSAPRSMFGGMALLDNDGRGTTCKQIIGPEDWPLTIVVAIISDAPKSITSRVGMERSRNTSDYYAAWTETHAVDMRDALDAIRRRDFSSLAEVAENNCLKMHSVMMTSRPALMYWMPETLAGMRKIMELRAGGLPVFFTIDAGPQVKAICLPEAAAEVSRGLSSINGVRRIIQSKPGVGARLVDQ